MKRNAVNDLRVKKTKAAIRHALEEMLCEMEYTQITIRELAARANINRKTFYLHYSTLDDLLCEVQAEIAQAFVTRTAGLKRPRDMDKITREFFLSCEELGKLGEVIICRNGCSEMNRQITEGIMTQTWKSGTAPALAQPLTRNIAMAYVSQSTLEMYRQWVADGRKLPLEDMIQLASQLICNGINSL